jgi:prepilin peptidase CpaA
VITIPIYIFILIELIFVAWGDYKTRKISNYWSILNIICFPILVLLLPSIYILDANVFIYSALFLLIGFILFSLKVMGGGDGKFLATFILIVPISLQPKLLNFLLISTILVASIFFIRNITKNFSAIVRSLKKYDFITVKSFFGSKFAFAPVILLAWILLGWEIRNNIF